MRDIIKWQQEEIERLKTDLEDLITEYEAYKEAVEVALVEARAEAIREFAEKLKEKASSCVMSQNGQEIPETKSYTISALCIDELVKEMTEKEGGNV